MTLSQARWLLLSYRLPREPSRLRLAVWRRLKRVGAVPLHGAVWTVPLDAKTREDFEWLAEEIDEAGGTVFVWQADSLDAEQNRRITARLLRDAENRYAALATAARTLGRDITNAREIERLRAALRRAGGLQRELRLERRRDFARAPGRTTAERAVAKAVQTLRARVERHAMDHSTTLSR